MNIQIISEYILPHWPFIAMSLVLGLIVNTCKKNIFAKENSKQNKIIHYLRMFLPLHAPVIGL